MYHPQNQYQKQQNFEQNYNVPININQVEVVNLDHDMNSIHLNQKNPLKSPANPIVHPVQKVPNIHQFQNYPNVQQAQYYYNYQQQKPIQNVNYIQIPEQENAFSIYNQKVKIEQGQYMKQNPDNIKINKADSHENKSSGNLMSLNDLAKLEYKNYPVVEFSQKPFLNISGYAYNSYHGTRKSYNEDMIKVRYNLEKNYVDTNNKNYKAFISYFAVFDGHGGDGCCKFLKEYLDEYLFNLQFFPINVVESIREAFSTVEEQFRKKAIQNGVLFDKSGSCAVIALIINNVLYIINLGDSRALYSRDGGKQLYQITRDHKPNDPKEKVRIEKAGGKVYYDNEAIINGVKVKLKEEQFGPGFKLPYRLHPSGLAVSSYF